MDLHNVVIALDSVVLVDLVGPGSVHLVVGDWAVVVMIFAVIQDPVAVCFQSVFLAIKSTLVQNTLHLVVKTLHVIEWILAPQLHSVVNATKINVVPVENGTLVKFSASQ